MLKPLLLSLIFAVAACGSQSSKDKSVDAQESPDSADAFGGDTEYLPDNERDSLDVSERARPATDQNEIIQVEEAEDCIDADEVICEVEVEILRLTNALRQQNNLPAFKNSARIAWVSRDWSRQQAENGSIGHRGFPRQRRAQYQDRFDRSTSLTAENVAYSYSSSSSVTAIAEMFHDMWSNSPGHRANMLGNHRYLGVGIHKSGNAFYGTQIFGQTD